MKIESQGGIFTFARICVEVDLSEGTTRKNKLEFQQYTVDTTTIL